ncbi:ATP-binding protein [Prosthecobacter sp.]|uniref:ATP-binding protein n=1 Tax=Prosthecobacter sp. TaxID=1965333 RepID=UPI001DADC11A|nr:ATP-binding protein [Prosthecobacter sp.]MCB1278916.1 ATP-binding protein [Prosthecobacter sp.]
MPTQPMPTRHTPEIELPPDAATVDDHRNPRRHRREAEEPAPELGLLVQPEARHCLDKLILHPEVKTDIQSALRALEKRADLERIWDLSSIQPMQGRCILNFYGPPGTGKTRAALGIAHRLGKPLYQVDYSAVISKYLGDTAKHIKAAFQSARELGAILFFDEADSLLSRRAATGESCSTSINQNRNTLMQELDRFDGVVIVTTNLFENYDPALLRRIQSHIHFRLPNASMRRELFALHLPNAERVTADFAVLAELSRGLSGGDILTLCLNAIHAGSTDPDPAQWRVTQEILEKQIAKVKKAKAEHSGEKGRRKRRIGFCS